MRDYVCLDQDDVSGSPPTMLPIYCEEICHNLLQMPNEVRRGVERKHSNHSRSWVQVDKLKKWKEKADGLVKTESLWDVTRRSGLPYHYRGEAYRVYSRHEVPACLRDCAKTYQAYFLCTKVVRLKSSVRQPRYISQQAVVRPQELPSGSSYKNSSKNREKRSLVLGHF